MSASPASEEQQSTGKEEITFRFCRECSNMLYPKEDRVNNRLMFACRTCQFSEPAPSSCVYRNTLSTTTGETAGVTQDVGSDPTLCGDGKPKDGGKVQNRSTDEGDTENGDRRESWQHIFQDWGEDDLCEEDS